MTLIFSIISTKISSLLLPPGSVATTDFVTAIPGILFVPCCKKPKLRINIFKNASHNRKSYEVLDIKDIKHTENIAAGPRGDRCAASITSGSLKTWDFNNSVDVVCT